MHLAERVRSMAVAKCDGDDTLRERCTECAIALAVVFERSGFSDTRTVNGQWRNGQNHWWVESGGKYWDLTATQFEPGLPPILVSSFDDSNYSYACSGTVANAEYLRVKLPTKELSLGFEIAETVIKDPELGHASQD